MDFVLAISTGVISGIAASGLFLWFSFSYFKPKVEISPHLAVGENDSGFPYIEIKFINLTKRALNNVKVEILKSVVLNVNGGTCITHDEIANRDIYFVSPYDKNDKDARYAFRVTEEADIKLIWPSDKTEFITIMVHATDAMSGFSQSFRREFRNISESVKIGKHGFGKDFNVVPNTR